MGIFRKVERWLNGDSRFVDTHLKGYDDKDEILIHASFSILCDYVEQELAWMNLICGEEKGFRRWWEMRKMAWLGRDPKSGLRHLDWEIGLEESLHQSESAKEIKELYLWWKARPNRVDPYDAAEIHKYDYLSMVPNPGLKSPEYREALGKANQIEEAYYQEDEDMLIRLAKVRRSLWT